MYCSIGLDPPSDTSDNKSSRQNVTTKYNYKLSQQIVTNKLEQNKAAFHVFISFFHGILMQMYIKNFLSCYDESCDFVVTFL